MSFTSLHAIANLVNFFLFAIVVAKFAGPFIAKNVKDRQLAIHAAVDEALHTNQKALTSLEETRARLANVDGELATLLADAKRIGALQAAAIEEAARQEAERLRSGARAEIERQRQAAVQDIRALMMRQAFERAARELQQSMTPERQRELVTGLIQKVGDGSLALK